MSPHRFPLNVALACCLALSYKSRSEPRPQSHPFDAVAPQDSFWTELQKLCGRAFSGKMTEGSPGDSAFRRAELTMHVLGCTSSEIRIPFHVGEDRSRTWVLTRTQAGLRIKHDHRHADGTPDSITQYGGDTRDAGLATRQEFYADAHTASLIPAARTNVWTVEVMPATDRFAYALRREGTDRRFRVEFDLKRPVAPPPPPWGAEPRLSDREARIGAGESCPPGMTETRPRICRAPEVPAPSILDYRPRSTLVTAAHPVPAAKYPAIDFHGHPRDMITSADGLFRLGAALDSLNLRAMVAADNLSGERLQRAVASIRSSSKMKDRVRVFAGIDFRNVGAGWSEKAVKQLEADVAAGAVGIGEISKSFGLTIKKSDGSRLQIDAPELDPVWAVAARLRIPVFIHTADPQEFFRPGVDYTNERWLELSLFPGRRYPQDQFPSFDQLMRERDNVFRKHPATIFVAAHMGWHANDLGRLGKLLDDFPNVYTEVGAVLYDIGRQPHGAQDFFVKYQDRILFGKDSFQPEEYPYYWRVFETRDEYFDYYRDYHASWKLYGIDLPDSVLKKVYYQNALRITRGLPQAAWAR